MDDKRNLQRRQNSKMPRTLPWLVDAARRKESKKPKSSSPAPKRQRDSSPEDLVDSDLNAIGDVTPKRKQKRRPNRTPSTSPPPAPPDVEYMREGYMADDIYMMVEDEFLSTAKMFTQHIHHAEYVRLKKLARSRGPGTLQSITRPTDGRTEQSNGLRLKLEGEEKQRHIKDGVQKARGDEDSSEAADDYMQDPQLAGLMTADSQMRTDLTELTKAKSNTRAAAGFSQSPRNMERMRDMLAGTSQMRSVTSSSNPRQTFEDDVYSEDSEDDLDAPSKPRRPTYAKTEKRQRETNVNREEKIQVQPQTTRDTSMVFKPFTKSVENERREDTASSKSTSMARISDNQKSAPEIHSRSEPSDRMVQPTAASEYLAKRRADKERKEREEKRKAKRTDDIPTFLI